MKEVIVSWGQTGTGINNHIPLFWADNGTRKPAVPMTHIPQVPPSKQLALETQLLTLFLFLGPRSARAVGLGWRRFMSLRDLTNPERWPMSIQNCGSGGSNFTSVSIFCWAKTVSNMLYVSSHGWVLCLLANGTLEGVASILVNPLWCPSMRFCECCPSTD